MGYISQKYKLKYTFTGINFGDIFKVYPKRYKYFLERWKECLKVSSEKDWIQKKLLKV